MVELLPKRSGGTGVHAGRIALVLVGESPRCAAALGVVDVLERFGLRVSSVVASGAGALVGATIAQRLPRQAAWRQCAFLWYPELTVRWTWRAVAQVVAPRWTGFGTAFGLRDGRPAQRRIDAAFAAVEIETLPVSLRIVTTEADSGKAVVVDQGSLSRALRAATATPLLYASVDIDGLRHSSGIVSDPLPLWAAADADLALVIVADDTPAAMPTHLAELVERSFHGMLSCMRHARLDAARMTGQQVICIQVRTGLPTQQWGLGAILRDARLGRQAARANLPSIFSSLYRSTTARVA